ncbi:uncharacterized protein LOC116343281 isoform X2 [Contarinia nasturtii]|uniref:uncharacterized protein LOC116343281 isoform X2 n=1 Tax=Contarinia nasturtii TaxID=265458 RepID=UPI0012D4A137|nr:uncharacterized protein LOC116343281 isoform X2 [Contarinia nasturtii]
MNATVGKQRIKIKMITSFLFDRNKIVSHLILVSLFLTIVTSEYVSREVILAPAVLPSGIDAVVGEDVMFKVVKPVAQQNQCYYQRVGGVKVDVKKESSGRIVAMDGEVCGLRIKKVQIEDHGLWRLTSEYNDGEKMVDVARGITFINVRNVDISPEQTTYCYVLRPGETKTAFPQYQSCEFPKLNDELEGNGIWNVVAGVRGKTQEISYKINVQKKVESLEIFVDQNTATTLNMKCKLMNNRRKMMKFCRFLQINDDVGYNLDEGRGDGRIKYYGNGFQSSECGVSIDNPGDSDKSAWKCFIGVEDDGEIKTFGAIIDPQTKAQATIDSSDVYGLENTEINILCKRYAPTDYCWFRDPSGQKILLSDLKAPQSTDKYRYYGTGIKMGECGLTILNAIHSQTGRWSCHMGSTQIAGTDQFSEISVRVAESPFVSTNLFQDAQQDSPLSVECRSIPEHVPVDYCRFVLPDGTGFSINEQVTASNLYMNNYYFNPNRKMKSGYCSIIVKDVDRLKHQGQWQCVARLTGYLEESSDEFRVTVFDSDNTLVAGLTGMIIAIIFVIFGGAFIIRRYHRQSHDTRSVTDSININEPDNISLRTIHSNNTQSDNLSSNSA